MDHYKRRILGFSLKLRNVCATQYISNKMALLSILFGRRGIIFVGEDYLLGSRILVIAQIYQPHKVGMKAKF